MGFCLCQSPTVPLEACMEEISSSNTICNGKKVLNFPEEVSGANEFRVTKRPRLDNHVSVGKFKGVVLQQNGHCGAQIYANHHRIWLGTFKSEKEAAMAYDSASIKLGNGDSHRNFPWTDLNIREPNFQNRYSTEEVLTMIKDGSYQAKFAGFLKRGGHDLGGGNSRIDHHDQFSCTQLFQKELTPSDVGKLNRLVIPKKFAVKYLPEICENIEDDRVSDNQELVFYDRLMKTWKFRYCYWRSSQSFVFTRGWNRFVKENNLKEKDIVSFYACVVQYSTQEIQHFTLIDITPSTVQRSMAADEVTQMEEAQRELELTLGPKEEKIKKMESDTNLEETGFRLFGVRIK